MRTVIPILKKDNKSSPLNTALFHSPATRAKFLKLYTLTFTPFLSLTRSSFCPFQHGFAKHFSCESQQASSIHNLASNLDNRIQTDVIIIGIPKALHTVIHSRPMTDLSNLNFSPTTLPWIRAFLTNRRQCCNVSNSLSNSWPVTPGVPQGSVLAPLFL